MKVQGQYLFDGPRQAVWDMLLDPDVLQHAVPGVQEWQEIGPHEYRTTLKVGLAAVKGTYSGTVTQRDLQSPERFTIVVQGKGPLGQLTGQGEVNLAAQGEQTLMEYRGDLQVGGTLAGVGQRVLPGVSKYFIDQGLKSLARTLATRQAASKA